MAEPNTAKKLLILMPWGRVGSNLLMSQLNGSFSSKQSRFANEKLSTIDQAAWFREFYGTTDASEVLVASKNAIYAIKDMNGVSDILEELGICLLKHRRDNLIKVAVSQLRGELYADHTKEQEGRTRWGVMADQKPLPPINLDPDRFVDSLHVVENTHKTLIAFNPDCPTFDLEYETLKADPVATARDVIAWLGLTPQRDVPLRFRKATPDALADAVPNLSELREAANRKGFEHLDPLFDS